MQNIITGNEEGINSKVQTKAKQFVESQLKKRLMSDNQQALLKKNMDSLNIPTQVDQMFPQKVQIYDQLRQIESQSNEYMN